MQIEPQKPSSKNPPEQFAGDDPATTTTWLEHITDADYEGTALIE